MDPLIPLALDGTLDASDKSAFYSLDGCRADFNQSGAVTVQDLFDFQNAWFAAPQCQ